MKAFRWATDRLRRRRHRGACDQQRASSTASRSTECGSTLAQEFDSIYVARPRRQRDARTRSSPGPRTTCSASRVGVCVMFLVRTKGKGLRARHEARARCTHHERAGGRAQGAEVRLDGGCQRRGRACRGQTLALRDEGRTWLTEGLEDDFEGFELLASSEERTSDEANRTIDLRGLQQRGVKTGRDAWVYNFDRDALADRVECASWTRTTAKGRGGRRPSRRTRRRTWTRW